MSTTIYLLIQHEYHKSGNYTEILGYSYTREHIQIKKAEYEERFKGKSMNSSFEFEIEETNELTI